MKRFFAWAALALGVLALAAVLTPWPSVWVIRGIFDKGAADASAALAKHVPAGIRTQTAIHYDPADPDALLDVHSPAVADPKAPTVVWIHGGGFVSGRRQDLTNYAKVLAGQGFTVVNVDYTIAPDATYPTPVRQFASALSYIDRNAQKLGVNRNALVVAGDSAGSQIAAQTANIITSPQYAKDVGIAAPIRPEQLKGALLWCGVYDAGAFNPGKGGVLGWFMNTVTWAYSGKRDMKDAPGFERMSVVHYVTPAFPPSFISAGNADPLEPQSVAMAAALKEKGVPVETLFYPKDHQPALPHEYQFNIDGQDGKTALDRSVAWLKGLSGPAA